MPTHAGEIVCNMANKVYDLGWVTLGGGPREIGQGLGVAGRAAVHLSLLPSEIWHLVNEPVHAERLARMAATVQTRHPEIWAEIQGLAEGLALPLMQVFAWNCRGDLLAAAPDGCTTVMLPGANPVLAHNEDGLPFFRGATFIADVTPDHAPGFRAFCYPGSIPGHTFAFNDAGLVQTVNNMRLSGVEAEIPRMVLGRAVLGTNSLDQALELLRRAPQSGGFHFALTHSADRRIMSVEFGGGEVSILEITQPALHANHALHQKRGLLDQIITASSHDRQTQGDLLLAAGLRDPLVVLRDTGGPGLPIRRDAADDPDDENTLATAILRVTDEGGEWSIYDKNAGNPAYAGTFA